MAETKPIKKKKAPPKEEYVPPIFVNGFTQDEAIAHIKQVIDTHRDALKGKPGTPLKHGWSEEDLYIRHQLILNWIGQGIPNIQVARMLRNIWGVTDSTSRLYVSEAMKYLTSCSEEYRENLRDAQIAKLEQWAEECRLTGKYMEASKFTDQLNKLYGLYVDNKKVELTGGPISVTFGE